MKLLLIALIAAAALAPLTFAPATRADEGMWLLNKPPVAQMKERYKFEPTAAWMEHVQKAAVNFDGSSGSFVSPTGLVMTNHHVGSDALAMLSTPERDLLKTGFLASRLEDELKVPNIELTILEHIEDVTDRVNSGVKPDMSVPDAAATQRTMIAAIEKEQSEKTGLRCRVVTLYNGGKFHLYCSRLFTDVRLVFAPEEAIAFFGGDTDNFEFPRYDLDCCFFRVYENGKPYTPKEWLKFGLGAKDGDLAIVVGHPGRTQRLLTVDDLKFVRDLAVPTSLQNYWRSEVKLMEFSGRSAENARIAREDFFGVANSRKAFTGQLAGLQDPVLMKAKQDDEERVRASVNANSQWRTQWGEAWGDIAAAKHNFHPWYIEWYLFDRPDRGGRLLADGLTLLRMNDELAKPSAERLKEFRDPNIDSTRAQLFSTAPMYDALEQFKLEAYMSFLAERLGADHAVVALMLDGKSPAIRAEEVIKDTKLKTVAARQAFAKLSREAAAASNDPLIVLARAMDTACREARSGYQDDVESVERSAYAKIAAARFALDGEKVYPDATGTLRLTFGAVKGYTENGKFVQPFTDFAGLYQRAAERKGQEGFALPESWIKAKDKLDLKIPFNFVCTCDIIGGNSGSPVVNRAGEVIGLIFDGNLQSLPGAFYYDGTANRALAVDVRGMIEAFKKVYGAEGLVKELTGK
ncbi:MAG: S46 family peptidase [Phycisphaerales bacterium]